MKNQCNCKEMSCVEGCEIKHTHKTFFCEGCSPVEERGEKKTIVTKESLKELYDTAFPNGAEARQSDFIEKLKRAMPMEKNVRETANKQCHAWDITIAYNSCIKELITNLEKEGIKIK